MNDIAREVEEYLRGRGMDLVGFADLAGLPAGHPRGIAVGVALTPAIAASLIDAPSRAYLEEYDRIYTLHDETMADCADLLRRRGYSAFAQSRPNLRVDVDRSTPLPHKTVAVRAGLGWIGRCALLITPEYGSAVRISSLTTDAPLPTAIAPAEASGCGSCTACVEGCPAGAVKGPAWTPGVDRDILYDAAACEAKARALSLEHIEGLREGITLCGRCIALCPYTKRHLQRVGLEVPQ